MSNINYYWSSLLIEELIRSGCSQFVVAPGSRSTPLVGAVANNKKARYVVTFDERSAGFFALGHAKATGYPAAIIVTSGTAVANLMPAVVEASLDRVPLLILSADRPPELRDVEANQTIDQSNFFAPYTRWFFDLPCPNQETLASLVLSTANYAIYKSRHPIPGPVQINCMLREPLAPIEQEYRPDITLKYWCDSEESYTQYEIPIKICSERSILKLALLLNQAKQGLIIAGASKEKKNAKAILELAHKLNWPIAADIASGLRQNDNSLIIRHDHHLWQHSLGQQLDFDMVLQFGGRIISKSLESMLKRRAGQTHIFVADHCIRSDPGMTVTHRLDCDIENLSKRLIERIDSKSHSVSPVLMSLSKELSLFMASIHSNFQEATEPFVARSISEIIAANSIIMACTSMPIRDYHYFASYRKDGGPQIVVNRGASGIDGLISTAIGYAHAAKLRSTVLIGDLAFLHDTNALALLNQLNYPMTIVVINNKGGGIFSFLPIASYPNILSPFIDSPHNHDLSSLSKAFGLRHIRVKLKREFEQIYKESQSAGDHLVIEVQSERKNNFLIHEKIQHESSRILI